MICVGLLVTSTGLAWMMVGVRRNISLAPRVALPGWPISIQPPSGWTMREFIDGGMPAMEWSSSPNEPPREIILSRIDGVGNATASKICEEVYEQRAKETATRHAQAEWREDISLGPYPGVVLEVRSRGYVVAVGLDESAPSGVDAYFLELISQSNLHEGDLVLFDLVLASIQAVDASVDTKGL